MSTLRAILELQGSLDTAVIRSQDARVAEIADQFLPGTSDNTEWYREIEAFMFPVADEEGNGPRTEANPIRALQEIEFDRTAGNQTPTIPEMSRLLYGIGAIIRLKTVVPTAPLPRLDDPAEEGNWNLLANVFALAGPETDFESNLSRLGDERLNDVTDVLANRFTSWRAWYDVANQLVEMQVLKPEIAAVPLCQAVVVTVDGIESVVVDTEFSSNEVSLNMLKAVVDPRNWNLNYPSFFCKMEYKGLRTDNWRRVLETVGICYVPEPFGRRLRTMLKFHKSTVEGPETYEARLDYDLNDPVPDSAGDGQITVDRGFINMWSPKGDPTKPPVAVRTRKVAHINGLRPYTMKRFVCVFGYGNAAMEMLFGSAKDPHAYQTHAPWLDPPEKPSDPSSKDLNQGEPTPPQSNNTVASTTITMVAQCVEELTAKQFDLADRWMSGHLTVDELAQHSAEVGARIASEPWRIIQAISKGKGRSK